MSYRDLRNFSETMRALGFPRQISLDSFRSPNFELVEECLRWLAARLDGDASLAGGSTSVEQRVALVAHAVDLFHSRANLRLNGRKLYGADGWAVRELLKVASLLRVAQQTQQSQPTLPSDDRMLDYDLSSRLGEMKQARSLATEITAQGAFLYDLLAKESDRKKQRSQAIARPLDMSAMEAALKRALAAMGGRVLDLREQMDNVSASEAALDAKLERRRWELDRASSRLAAARTLKPAYQSELSALEGEIEQLWDQYVVRFRTVEALKHQLSTKEAHDREAAEEQQAAIMQLITKYEAEEVLGKLSDSEDAESSDDVKAPSTHPRPATRPRTRLRIKTAGRDGAGAGSSGSRAFGTMGAQDSLDELHDEDDSNSDSDTQILYGGSATASSTRPRPATRGLRGDDRLEGLLLESSAHGSGSSLGSASEWELMASAAPSQPPAHSDNDF